MKTKNKLIEYIEIINTDLEWLEKKRKEINEDIKINRETIKRIYKQIKSIEKYEIDENN